MAAEVAHISVPEFVAPSDREVILNRMRFHYLDWGQNGPPILWLHGGALTAHTYDLVCLAMRANYHCIALDQRGHGDSEWSPTQDYGYKSHASDITSFVALLGWQRFVLVGMSMGGLNSIAYAAENSDRLAGLVLIDVGPEVRPAGAARIRDFTSVQVLDSVDDFVTRAMEFNPRRNPQLLRRSLHHNLRQRPDGKWMWKWDPRPREARAREGAVMEEVNRRSQLLWADVDRIGCPTLVVRGAESDVFLDDDAAKLTARLKRGRTATIPGAGHTVQGDNPGALIKEITRFLRDIPF
jgi:esterase